MGNDDLKLLRYNLLALIESTSTYKGRSKYNTFIDTVHRSIEFLIESTNATICACLIFILGTIIKILKLCVLYQQNAIEVFTDFAKKNYELCEIGEISE